MSTSRTGAPPNRPVSDDEIRSLLDHYRCPMPFHVVRTRVLGNIASPDMTASPMDTVAGLWGGELPAIDNLDALNELLRVLLDRQKRAMSVPSRARSCGEIPSALPEQIGDHRHN